MPGTLHSPDLERLYERLWVRLPAEIERSLLRHDGSGLTVILPPGYALLGIEDILKQREIWMKYGALHDVNLEVGDKLFLVPFATLSVSQLLVDTRTGRLAWWDIEQCFLWNDEPLWNSLTSALECVGNLLASPPPWIAMLPGEEE